VVFAYWHIHNLGATPGYLIFVFFFGVLMSYAFFRTGQLWLAIGLHAGWDFFAGIVFGGTPINGLDIFHLMNIKYLYQFSIGYYGTDIIVLLLMAVFINHTCSHQKPEPLDW